MNEAEESKHQVTVNDGGVANNYAGDNKTVNNYYYGTRPMNEEERKSSVNTVAEHPDRNQHDEDVRGYEQNGATL